ncbi:MAG: hypothetical protein DRP42_06540 [Tenericutes bacterium]|nr:MAG: hypothetical protein DRP42_06540 [Mycoplasmatota bacterium]
MVVVKIDFSSYYTKDIIAMLESGIVSIHEVRESRVAETMFSKELSTYIDNNYQLAETETA